jgi:dTDP-4-amino-4,6-dideoxygalactose transaminase
MTSEARLVKTIVPGALGVPFADLYSQYQTIKADIDAAIADVIASSAFVRGRHVIAFENEFAAAIGAKFCVSCANGTDALYIAMRALGVKPGDEIITTAHSWISTSEAITQAGGTPVFCDTEQNTFTLDVSRVKALITPRTIGIIPVHLYGQPADLDAVMAIAQRHGLWVIEDCAQAHLATYKGQTVGTFGVAGTFSFYPGKNLGAMGDAGAIVTNDGEFARRMAMLARHGGVIKGEHEIEGVNSRLDGLQAAILSVKLPHLAKWTARRQELARGYERKLRDIPGLTLPIIAPERTHVWHLYVVRHDKRDSLAAHLNKRGVQTVINYPVALPFLAAYARFGHRPEEFPCAYRNQSRILSLPMFAEMTERHLDDVCDSIASYASCAE